MTKNAQTTTQDMSTLFDLLSTQLTISKEILETLKNQKQDSKPDKEAIAEKYESPFDILRDIADEDRQRARSDAANLYQLAMELAKVYLNIPHEREFHPLLRKMFDVWDNLIPRPSWETSPRSYHRKAIISDIRRRARTTSEAIDEIYNCFMQLIDHHDAKQSVDYSAKEVLNSIAFLLKQASNIYQKLQNTKFTQKGENNA